VTLINFFFNFVNYFNVVIILFITLSTQSSKIQSSLLICQLFVEITRLKKLSQNSYILKAFWRENGHSGEIVTNGGPTDIDSCDSGPICIVFDASTPKKSPALVAFIAGYQAIQWGRLDVSTSNL